MPLVPLVPKLWLGHALVPEVLLRRARESRRLSRVPGAGKRSFQDRGIPKQELGNEEDLRGVPAFN